MIYRQSRMAEQLDIPLQLDSPIASGLRPSRHTIERIEVLNADSIITTAQAMLRPNIDAAFK